MRRRGATIPAECAAGAALILLLAGLVHPACAESIRVALEDGIPVVEVGTSGPLAVRDAASRRVLFETGPRIVRIVPAGSGLDVGTQRVAAAGVRLETVRGPVRVGRWELEGALEVWRSGSGGGLLLINETALEEYVAGTIRGEMPERWPFDAVRAMAVVARTYAVYQRARSAGRLFHLVAGVQDQRFTGRVEEDSPAWAAARETAGQLLTLGGRVIPAFYHSDSGGATEAARLVFSGEGVESLPGVADEFSAASPHATWQLELPLARIGERLRAGGVTVGTVRDLTVVERSPSSRVARMAVAHSAGTTVLRGVEFRRLIGYDVLRSTLFDVTVGAGRASFRGRGWGHGVGLSQFGAREMAERGFGYARILEHYYPGTVLGTLR